MPQRDKQAPCYGACPTCGKLCYTTRKDARRAASRHPGADLRPYQCPAGHGWHLGHLRPAVVQGQLGRATAYHHQPERTSSP